RPGPEPDLPFNFRVEVCEADQGRGVADAGSRGLVGRGERVVGLDQGLCDQILRRIEQWRPDVVLGMGYLSLPYLARLRHLPTVCDLQDDEALHRWRELWHGRMNRKREDLKCLVAAGVYERAFIPRVGAVTVL